MITPPRTFCLAHADYSPWILGIPRLRGRSRGYSGVQMAEGNMKQPLGTEFQYAAFEKTPAENWLFFPCRSLNVFICSSDAEWIMEAHPQAPKKWIPKDFLFACETLADQMSKEGFRTAAGVASSRQFDCSFWAHMAVFSDSETSSCRHWIWNLNWLNAETSLHKKRTALDNLWDKRGCDVLHHVGTMSDPSSYSQALPSSPPARQPWPGVLWPPPALTVLCGACPGKPESGPLLLRRHFKYVSFW